MLFNDENNDIAGSFNCVTGGILAFGGWWTDGSNHSTAQADSATTFKTITEGDIVTQDGIECWLDTTTKGLIELLNHEFGHALGIDHSTVFNAAMWPNIKGAGRGAFLDKDDKDATTALEY